MDSSTTGLTPSPEQPLKTLSPHPRLLLTDDDLQFALESAKTDPLRANLHSLIIMDAERELDTEPVFFSFARHYKKHGPDIKRQGRDCTPRILTCSLAFRLTRDVRFLHRAVAEMKALASFPSWHPILFLGTSEISTAVSIGYDWLYNDMTPEDREIIADAIFRHCLSLAPAVYGKFLTDGWLVNKQYPDYRGPPPEHRSPIQRPSQSFLTPLLKASIDRIGGHDHVYRQCLDGGEGLEPDRPGKGRVPWVTKNNNWNQNCNCGMLAAALALADREESLSTLVVLGVLQSLPLAIKHMYAPDGAYPEGPQYWSHATTKTVMSLSMFKTALGTDFNLSDIRGFDRTATYRLYARGPSGQAFNYADASADLLHDAALSWLSNRFQLKLAMKQARDSLAEVVDHSLQASRDFAEEYRDRLKIEEYTNRTFIKSAKKKIDKSKLADRFLALHAVWFPMNVSKQVEGKAINHDYSEKTCSEMGGGRQVSALGGQGSTSSCLSSGNNSELEQPPLDARFRGNAELAIFRSSWEPTAVYLGFKAGTNDQSHGHLDLGSFVLESGGVRFAMDMGKDNYALYKYHSRLRKSPRWNLYMRSNNWGHNCMAVGEGSSEGSSNSSRGSDHGSGVGKLCRSAHDCLQDIEATAPIISFHSSHAWAHAIADLSSTYPLLTPFGDRKYAATKKDKIRRKQEETNTLLSSRDVKRGVALINRRQVLVQDEITVVPDPNKLGTINSTTTNNNNNSIIIGLPTDYIWRMFTEAEVEYVPSTSQRSVLLTHKGQVLRADILFAYSEVSPSFLERGGGAGMGMGMGEAMMKEGRRIELSGAEFKINPATPKEFLDEEAKAAAAAEEGVEVEGVAVSVDQRYCSDDDANDSDDNDDDSGEMVNDDDDDHHEAFVSSSIASHTTDNVNFDNMSKEERKALKRALKAVDKEASKQAKMQKNREERDLKKALKLQEKEALKAEKKAEKRAEKRALKGKDSIPSSSGMENGGGTKRNKHTSRNDEEDDDEDDDDDDDDDDDEDEEEEGRVGGGGGGGGGSGDQSRHKSPEELLAEKERNKVFRQDRNEGITCLSIYIPHCFPPSLPPTPHSSLSLSKGTNTDTTTASSSSSLLLLPRRCTVAVMFTPINDKSNMSSSIELPATQYIYQSLDEWPLPNHTTK